MSLILLSRDDVERLLPIRECIEVMAEALRALARGEIHQPLRTGVLPPEASGLLGLMPAYRKGERAAFALKEVCVFPGNPERGLDAHQGAVLLHSAETGELQAIANASAVTAIRTAAVSAVATRELARDDSRALALFGAGVQARSHLEAMVAVRELRSLRVVSRRPERAAELAAYARQRFSFVSAEAVESPEEAARGADVIVTATSSRTPVLRREWIAAGTHINAVGSSSRRARELDAATLAASSFFVDRRESTLAESGDYLLAVEEGTIGPQHIRAELGEVLTGERPGRTSTEEITVFKSLGIAAEDLAAIQYLYGKALETRSGTRVDF